MMQNKSEDAVSPVIGVMLMVVLTVVIAGVIAAFGTGMVTDVKPVPNAVLDVEIKSNVELLTDPMYAGLTGPDFWITHISGDEVDTRDIEIRLSWMDQNGVYHISTYSAEQFRDEKGIVNVPNSYGGANLKQPMYVKTTKHERTDFGSGGKFYYFGDAVLTPGLKLTAGAENLHLGENNKGNPSMDVIFDSNGQYSSDDETYGIMKYLPKGTAVNVMILHLPSNKAIFEKEVMVE